MGFGEFAYPSLPGFGYPSSNTKFPFLYISVNQTSTLERNSQVSQIREVYENAERVLMWLGPDTEDHQAETAIHSIVQISDFLCQKLGYDSPSALALNSNGNIYREILFENRSHLPVPNECEFSTEAVWKSLAWFYSHSYFTQVRAIQEVNANKKRSVYCGRGTVEWERVELVAGYIILQTAFSKKFGFTNTNCWWVATVAAERMGEPRNWLFMLYLASNFRSTDARDVIYGLQGLMKFSDKTAQRLLDPDYSKSVVGVYRDVVEAAFLNFQNTDVLLYVTGNESPSWIPRWDRPMLFRNPFRFGNAIPWKPAGDTKPEWDIDKETNVLSLSGFVVDSIESVQPYNESIFDNAMLQSDDGRNILKQIWLNVLETAQDSQTSAALSRKLLSAAAMSFSFGLDENTNVAEDESRVLRNFIAYLRSVLDDDEAFTKYIPPDLREESIHADGHAFGKPVWDFEYPESSFFITQGGLIGCSVSSSRPGDVVAVALGNTYPFILRPEGDYFLIRGYAYVDGIMHGERQDSERQDFKIR